jgi:hypothetical protein
MDGTGAHPDICSRAKFFLVSTFCVAAELARFAAYRLLSELCGRVIVPRFHVILLGLWIDDASLFPG